MRRAHIIGMAALVIASGLGTSTFALDSTSRQRIDSFGWQPPNARTLNNKSEGQLDVNSSATSTYATTANSANYATSAGTSVTAATAASIPASNITGIPSCSSGYTLMKSGSTFTCVNRTALANDLYGAPSCSSGQALSRNSSGTYSCVSTSGGGSSGPSCSSPTTFAACLQYGGYTSNASWIDGAGCVWTAGCNGGGAPGQCCVYS